MTTANGTEIFSGKAYKMPGETNLKVNLNNICAPYLGSQELPSAVWTMPSGATLINAIDRFYMHNAEDVTLKWEEFLDDWSYEDLDGNDDLSEIINGHYAPNMICLNTVVEYDEQEGNNNGVLNWGPGSAIDGYTTSTCGNAALYYKTRRGGWASFLVEGIVKRYDDYTWAKYKKFNPNTSSLDRGETTYLNEIQPRWELNTSLLNDDESIRLAQNLLSSTRVYLHLLDTDEIFPVTITNANTEHKTYRANSRKRVSYQITVTAANKRIRR